MNQAILKERMLAELVLRAGQERMVSTIGRTTKASRDAHEHTAKAMESLAADLARGVFDGEVSR